MSWMWEMVFYYQRQKVSIQPPHSFCSWQVKTFFCSPTKFNIKSFTRIHTSIVLNTCEQDQIKPRPELPPPTRRRRRTRTVTGQQNHRVKHLSHNHTRTHARTHSEMIAKLEMTPRQGNDQHTMGATINNDHNRHRTTILERKTSHLEGRWGLNIFVCCLLKHKCSHGCFLQYVIYNHNETIKSKLTDCDDTKTMDFNSQVVRVKETT